MTDAAVLIIGGGMLQVPLVREAQALGLLPLVTDRNPHAPAFQLPGVQPFVLSTVDVFGHEELMRALMRMYTVRGVCTAGADVAPTVAAAAAVAGTPGIPLEVAQRTYNKAAVREALSAAGLDQYQPAWCTVEAADPPQALPIHQAVFAEEQVRTIQWCYGISMPCVVKPLDQRASRGVTMVHTIAQYVDAKRQVHTYGPTCLVEASLAGTEHSVEGLLGPDGFLHWFNIVDRFFDYSSGVPIETGHVNPSALALLQTAQLQSMFLQVAHALGVTWGPFKIDALVTQEGDPKVLECTARLSGGWDCQGTSPLTGRHPMRALLQLACGMPVDAPLTWAPGNGYAACSAVLPPQQGRIQRLPYLMDIGAPPYVEVVYWHVKPGDVLDALKHNSMRPGFVLAVSSQSDVAWQRAKTAADALAGGVEVFS